MVLEDLVIQCVGFSVGGRHLDSQSFYFVDYKRESSLGIITASPFITVRTP